MQGLGFAGFRVQGVQGIGFRVKRRFSDIPHRSPNRGADLILLILKSCMGRGKRIESGCGCVCMYVCMYVRTYVCMSVCMYVGMYACMHVCMYVWMVM